MPAHPLTRAQVKAVLKNTQPLRDQALLVLGFQTGFRVSELLSLTIGKVADSQGQIKPILTVSKSHMKGKKLSRTVRLTRCATLFHKPLIVNNTQFYYGKF